MKHQYLVDSKQEGLPKEGLCTVSCTRDTVKNLVGEFLTYKLDKEGSLKTKVIKQGKTWDVHAIKIKKQPRIDK